MKDLKDIIQEKLKINSKSKVLKYNYQPKSTKELHALVKELIEKRGNNADLNDIDTSKITNMEDLFTINNEFNGDISEWDVSNVTCFRAMFAKSKFNGNISKWTFTKKRCGITMTSMFYGSEFNQDISKWDVSNVDSMMSMFGSSKFNQDISKWDVSNVEHMQYMFYNSEFNQDISEWNVSKVEATEFKDIFKGCPLEKNPPKWYKDE